MVIVLQRLRETARRLQNDAPVRVAYGQVPAELEPRRELNRQLLQDGQSLVVVCSASLSSPSV